MRARTVRHGQGAKMTTSHGRTDLGRVISSYPSYEEAQALVDRLADRMFQVEHVTIIARDLHPVEWIMGRLTIWRSALAGAATGAWFGLLVGLVFWIVSPWETGAMLSAVLLGLVFGAAWGTGSYLASGGHRGFTSVPTMAASHYQVMVDTPYADDALRVIGSPQTGVTSLP
jgi:Heat induced stress protein YflT domain